MHKKKLFFTSFFSCLFLFLCSIATVKENVVLTAEEINYTLELNSDNKPILSDGSGDLFISNHASLHYENASSYEKGHITLLVGGTISKNEAAFSLLAMTAIYDGNIVLETGYSQGVATYRYDDLVSGETKSIQGNYFVIKAVEETNITSISLKYVCTEEEIEGEHEYSETYSYNETHHWRDATEEYYVNSQTDYEEHTLVSTTVYPSTKNPGKTQNHCDICDGWVGEITNETGQLNPASYSLFGKTVSAWNSSYPNTEAVVTKIGSSNYLDIYLKEDTTTEVTYNSTFNSTGTYTQISFSGPGSIHFKNSSADLAYINNLVINENANVTFEKTGTREKTAMKLLGTLTVAGNFTITNYGYGIGAWNTNEDFTNITVTETGNFNIPNSNYGIWTDSDTTTPILNVAGKLNIYSYRDCLRFNNTCDMYFTGNAEVNITSETGVGIWNTTTNGHSTPTYNGSGEIYIRDNAKVNMDVADNGIWGASRLFVANGSNVATASSDESTNTASLIIKSKGTTRGYDASKETAGTKDSNTIDMAAGCIFILNTTGKVEFTRNADTVSKTCVRFNGGSSYIIVKTTDFSIINYLNALGNWSTWSGQSVTYEYEGLFKKMNVIGCSYIFNTTFNENSNVLKTFNSNTVNFNQ